MGPYVLYLVKMIIVDTNLHFGTPHPPPRLLGPSAVVGGPPRHMQLWDVQRLHARALFFPLTAAISFLLNCVFLCCNNSPSGLYFIPLSRFSKLFVLQDVGEVSHRTAAKQQKTYCGAIKCPPIKVF